MSVGIFLHSVMSVKKSGNQNIKTGFISALKETAVTMTASGMRAGKDTMSSLN